MRREHLSAADTRGREGGREGGLSEGERDGGRRRQLPRMYGGPVGVESKHIPFQEIGLAAASAVSNSRSSGCTGRGRAQEDSPMRMHGHAWQSTPPFCCRKTTIVYR